MTGLEYLEWRLARLGQEIDRLGGQVEYDAEDPRRYVRDAAAILERFLQRCTLTRPPAKRTLFGLIEALAQDEVPPTAQEQLHDVRKAANVGKHNARRQMSTLEAGRLIEQARSGVAALGATRIPELARTYTAQYRRRYVIGVYDHLGYGEVEYAIWLAAYPPTGNLGLDPPLIESFQLRYEDEEKAKALLEATGQVVYEKAVPQNVFEALRADGEFTAAWLWEGAHQDLVAAFAPHQHSMDLLPGLLRGDHEQSVLSAAASAAVEMLRPFDWRDLMLKIDTDYGISRRGTVVRVFAERMAQLVAEVPEETVLGGPRWLDWPSFEQATAEAPVRDQDLGIAVLADGTVVVGLETQGHGLIVQILEDEDLMRPEDPLGP
jgi:hypothetical protein